VTSLRTWEDIHTLAERVCKHFALRWPVTFEPLTRKRARCARQYGECEYDHCPTCTCAPVIRLRLTGRRPLKAAAILAVLAHELAHLQHLRHGRRHAHLTREIAGWLITQGHACTPNMLVVAAKKKKAR
jgi:hypothetical protein